MGSTAHFARPHLADCVPDLVATARGDKKATLVIQHAKLVNVTSGEILDDMSIGVQGARIAFVGKDASHLIGDHTRIIDSEGRYVAPGLLDGHCHIESSQITPTQFARAVLVKGTTGGFFDAHEITNVLGLTGLRLMLEEARTTPLAAYMQVASCVPSTGPELETAGASIGPKEVAEAFTWGSDMIALGEVMNFPGVVFSDEKMIGEIQAALRAGRVADGHYTWPVDDWRLPAYAASGITGCHESVNAEDVIARVRLGMYAKMRRGSAWHDVAESIKAHTDYGIDTRRMMLVTDDRSPESLVDEGHMDFVVRHAIAQGVRPVTAFQMATINTAERFGLTRDIGSITPGAFADIIMLDGNLADVNVTKTIAAGQVVAEDGRMVADLPEFEYPEAAIRSIRLARSVQPEDFIIEAPVASGVKTARSIQVRENHVDTKELLVSVRIENSIVKLDGGDDLCKIAVIERHKGTGKQAIGLVSDVGFNMPAAIATTVAHDCHNLMVIGNSDALMAQAANAVADIQGGIAVVTENGVSKLPLPVAGLMSNAPFEQVAEQSRAVSEALKKAGCTMNYAFMTLSLLALIVIPELRLSDIGLIKTTEQGFVKVPLFVE
ncbi:Adenine deaminase [Paenibacillus larvae subsp. larvae]|uniref:Adenine deaminase n=1 Tax=Paenibacillus larvae subsp. larvae TaxID=147375 RepID=A0A2L1TV57_9BACL|nr:adenine deaminase C-terminal domain-containing protein [Paenibacillus larvae]AQT85260.1 adenosine deaminase [Paenibacillus larvae subsp. pulvifaciens]AQZ47266.1 adenosine deaminase [Paenibacillus larvae subsp. pulvifaciens]AVF24563.1 Adenine deaminase [Paenibacillus larvae subsp. larvae]AVF29324.1 Adenine deaminase [Paenibacillus larvae subsp. larvae]MBH0342419.1 adenine deaminase [Paenibacillus larvae]